MNRETTPNKHSSQKVESMTTTPVAATNMLVSNESTAIPNVTSNPGTASKNTFMRTIASVKAEPQHKEGPVKVELPVFKAKNECNVIKIIQKEWNNEVARLNQKKFGKKFLSATDKSLV